MQGSDGKLLACLPSQLVLGAQPLSQPLASMSFDSSISGTDWSQTEIVSPPDHDSIECRDDCFLGQQVLFRPVSWLIASQTRCTHFFDGVLPR